MSDCIGAPAHEWLERYVDGTLPEDEAQKFEDHYFDCPVCLAELQSLQAAQHQLRNHPVPVRAAEPKGRILFWPSLVTAGALAAGIFAGVLTYRMVQAPQPTSTSATAHPAPAPSPAQPNTPPQTDQVQIAQLADLNLPNYHAPTLRGESSGSAYEKGMQEYASGNCRRAVATLSQVAPDSPDGIAAQFYTGLCRMHSGDLAGASASLHRVTAAGDSPELESAWYYLAQIALAHSDPAQARRDLRQVIVLHGDFEKRARIQLTKLPQ